MIGMMQLIAHAALAYLSLDEMVAAGEHVVEQGTLEQLASRRQRFAIAADAALSLEYGAYGEFPVRSMAQILQHPLVREAAESPNLGDRGSADDAGGGAIFIDYGSGAGRLFLAVAAMHDWGGVVGVEAMEALHDLADTAVHVAEQRGSLREGVARSVHSGDSLPHEEPVAREMARADVIFLYSTAFPSEDGLRLPRLSASLACVLREGALVVTADKWLVGDRFHFETLITVSGENDESIQAHLWRVVGAPVSGGFEAALVHIDEHWADDDACKTNERACHALLAALGETDAAEDE